jgi:hypothetical protein
MVLHDNFYEGQLVALQPIILDLADVRDLPLKGTSRDQSALAAQSSDSAPSSARRKSVGEADGWTDGDDEDEEKEGDEDDEETSQDAFAAFASGNAAYSRLADGGQRSTAAEEELKKRLIVLEEEVLVAHRICRNMFNILKEWMEPLLGGGTKHYIMPDDEVVSKLISVDRTTREPYVTAAAKNTAAVPGQATVQVVAPKSTRQLWRQLVDHAVTDGDVEERLRGKGSKLLKSMESMVCRHFLFLRQYVKRVRMRERSHGVK